MSLIGRDYRKRLKGKGFNNKMTKKERDKYTHKSSSSSGGGGGGGSKNVYTGGTGGGGYGAQTQRQIQSSGRSGAKKNKPEQSRYIPPQKARNNNYTGGTGAGGYGAQTRRGIDNKTFIQPLRRRDDSGSSTTPTPRRTNNINSTVNTHMYSDWRKTQAQNQKEQNAQARLQEAARRRVDSVRANADREYRTLGEQLPGKKNYREHNLEKSFEKDLEASEPKWHSTSRKSGYYSAGGSLIGGRRYYIKDAKNKWQVASYEEWKKQNDHDQKEEEKYRRLAATDPRYKNDPRANWDDYGTLEKIGDTISGAAASSVRNLEYGLNNNNSVNHRQMALGAPAASLEDAEDKLKIAAALRTGGEKAAREMRDKLAKQRKKEKGQRFAEKMRDLNAIDKKAAASEAQMEAAKHGTSGIAKFGLETLGAMTGMAVDIGIGAATGLGAIPSMAVRAAGGSARQADRDEYGRSKTMQALRSGGVDAAEKQMEVNRRFGAVSGAIEGLSEKIFAIGAPMQKLVGKGFIGLAEKDLAKGIKGTGDRMIRNMAKKVAKGKAGQNLVTAFTKAGVSMTGEGLEEIVAGVLNPIAEKMIVDKDKDLDWGQIMSDSLNDALVGAAIGGVFGGAEVINQQRQGKFVREKAGEDELIKQGLRSDQGTKAHQIATTVQDHIDRGGEMSDFDALELNQSLNETISQEQEKFVAAERKSNRELEEEFGKDAVGRHRENPVKEEYMLRQATRQTAEERGEQVDEQALDEDTVNVAAVKHYEKTIDDATDIMQKKLQAGFAAEAEEGEEVDVELPELDRENGEAVQAIANIAVGEAEFGDYSLFSESDPIARETLQETLGIELPDGNEATRDALIELNMENRRNAVELGLSENVTAEVDQQLGTEGHKQFTNAMTETGVSSDNYATAYDVFKYYYDAGMKGSLSFDQVPVPGHAKNVLPREFMERAYTSGHNAASEIQKLNEGKVRKATNKKESRFKDETTEEFRGSLKEKDKAHLDKVSEILKGLADIWKVNITLVDGDATKNGRYENGTIYINANISNILMDTFLHEFMHHMEKVAPKEWKAYADFVAQKMNEKDPGSFERAINKRMRLYSRSKETALKNREDARREVIADSTRALLEDKNFPKKLARHDASLAAKIADIIKKIIEQIKQVFNNINLPEEQRKAAAGKLALHERQRQEFAALWKSMDDLDALKDRWVAAAEAQLENESSSTGGTQYEINQKFKREEDCNVYIHNNQNGENETVIDENILQGIKKKKRRKFVADYLNSRIGEKYVVQENGHEIYIGAQADSLNSRKKLLPNKYQRGKSWNRLDGKRRYAKQKAIVGIGHMIEIATFDGHTNKTTNPNPNKPDKHAHDAKYGFNHYKSIFRHYDELSNKYVSYEVELLTRLDEDGCEYLYDIQGIEEKKETSVSSTTKRGKASRETGTNTDISSDKSITQKEIEDNKKQKKTFSLKEPVEQVRDLLAVHNLTEDKLLRVLKLGGFPMPSIAVTNLDHSNFGAISVLFGKETIDAGENKANKVYSADAWTPTVPQTEYEVDYDTARQAQGQIEQLTADNDYFNHLASNEFSHYNAELLMNREGGLKGYIDRLMDNAGVKYAYLKSKGEDVQIKQRKVPPKYDPKDEAKYIQLLYAVDHHPEELVGTGHDLINDERLKKVAADLGYELGSTSVFNGNRGFVRLVRSAYRYATEPETNEMENDYDATSKAMDGRIDKEGMRHWLENMLDGIVADEGIWNGMDPFTPAGNSRSFKQLHYPVTAENIVKAMKAQGSKNVSVTHGIKPLRAELAKTFKNVDDIRKNKSRLKDLSEEELQAISDELDEVYSQILNEIYDANPKRQGDNSFFTLDSIASIMEEVAKVNIQPALIIEKYSKYGWEVPKHTASKMAALFNAVHNMPVNMFEAKPERVVGFDEIKQIILPESASKELKDALSERSIPYSEYDPGKEGERAKAVNDAAEEQDVKFSLAEDSQGNKLTERQMEFFKESKIRDERGRLAVMYHGSQDSGFTVFDPDSGISSRAFFFVDSNDVAKGYSGTRDIFKPKVYESLDDVNDHIKAIGYDDRAVQDGDEYIILEDGEEILRNGSLSDLAMEYDEYSGIGGESANYAVYLNAKNPLIVDAENSTWEEIPYNGETVTSNWLADHAREEGYDGLIIKNVVDSGLFASSAELAPQTDVVVFDSNQIKSIDNQNPTEDPDIRYSVLDEATYDSVSLSPERLDHLIREYAQPGNMKGDYSKAWIATIDPRDFLRLTVADETLDTWRLGTKNAWGQEVRPLNRKDLKNEIQMPFLEIDTSESHSVIGHEGRHRMLALWRAGYTNIPVVIIDTSNKESKESMDSIDLWSQDFGKGAINDWDMNGSGAMVEAFDLIPINEKHKAEIAETYVENTRVQFSVNETAKEIDEKGVGSVLLKHHGRYKSDKQNYRAARDAASDLYGLRHVEDSGDIQYSVRDTRDSTGIKTIGRGISTQFIRDGYIDFRGKKIGSARDLAELTQIIRDNRFETFRLFYMRKGKIVAVDNVSSRLPGMSRAFVEDNARDWFANVEDRMNRLRADGYYMLHNHPSGDVTASSADMGLTRNLTANVPGFKGHVILDHEKYGFIDPGADFSEEALDGQGSIDFMNTPSINHPLLGESLTNDSAVARVAKEVVTSEDVSAVFFTTAKLKIREIQLVSNAVIKNDKNFINYIKNEKVRSGSAHAFVGTKDISVFSKTREAYEKGIVLDVVKLDEKTGKKLGSGGEWYNRARGYDNGYTDEEVRRRTRRYSLSESPEDYERENAKLRRKVEQLRSQMRLSHGTILQDKDATRIARHLFELPGYMGGLRLNDVNKQLKEIYALLAKDDTMDEGLLKAMELARDIVNNSGEHDEDAADEFKALSDYLKNTPVYIDEAHQGEVAGRGEFSQWRKSMFGTLKIVGRNYPGAKGVDEYMIELEELFPNAVNQFDGSNNEYDRFNQMLEYRESLKNSIDTYYSSEDDLYGREMVADVASIIFDELETAEPGKTFADRKKEEKQRAVQKTKDRYDIKIKKIRKDKDDEKKRAIEKTKQHYQELLQKVRAQKDASTEQKLRARMEKEQAREQRRKENINRRTLRSSIERDAKQLSDMLLKPTDKKHLPAGYDKAIAELLSGLDFESVYTDAWIRKYGKPSSRVMNLRGLREQYAKIANSGTSEIEASEYMMMLIEAVSHKVDGQRLSDLDTKTLHDVRTIIKAIKYQIQNINRAFSDGIKQTISDLGDATIAYMEDLDDQKVSGGAVGRARDFINVSNAKPVDFFDRVGSPLKDVFGEIVKGEDKHIRNIKDVQKFIQEVKNEVGGKKPFDKWSGEKAEAKTFILSDGSEIELTPAQIMSLYALNRRDQARRHIYASGIVVAPVSRKTRSKIKKKLFGDQLMKTHVHVTYSDVAKIVASMTEEQKMVADKFMKFMNKECKDWGNETSMKLYGYEAFREPNYFPIKSSEMFLNESTQEKGNAISKLKNTGFTKATQEFADNPIVIDDFFRVATGHINTMSMYNAFVPAITDFERVYNYNNRTGRGIESSVKQMINKKYGNAVSKYITTLLQDLNTQYNKDQSGLSIADDLLRKWKSVKIGANARVLVQQPTAITRAQVYIDYKYLAKSMAKNANPKTAGETKRRMWDVCPIAYWKHLGFAQTDVSRDMNDILMGNSDSKWNTFAFGMYGFADDVAWTRIFGAVEEEMRAEHPEIAEGSNEWNEKVNERFRYIVDRTQVVDSTLHRSQVMRSKDWYMRSITSFMAEPTTQINMWLTMIKTARDQLKSGDKAGAAKTMTRFGQNYLISMVALSVAASLISAMRESWTGDDDDDEKLKDKSFIEKWLGTYAVNDFMNNVNLANQLPWIKDVISLFEGYDVQRADLSMIADAVDSIKKFKEYLDKDGDVKYSWKKLITDATADGAALFGIPVSNIERDIMAARKTYFNAMQDSDYAHFKADSFELNPQKNKGKFIDYYLNALEKGNKETSKEIREFLKENGITQEDIDRTVSTRLNKEVNSAIDKKDPEKIKEIVKRYKKNYDYSNDDVSRKVRNYFSNELKAVIEKGDIKALDKVVANQRKYGMSKADIESSVSYWTNRYYKTAIEKGNTKKMDAYDKLLRRSGMSDKDIYLNRGNQYIGYYDMLIYNAGSNKERHRLAREVAKMFPDMTGENYILEFVGTTKSRTNIDNWKRRKWTKAQISRLRHRS